MKPLITTSIKSGLAALGLIAAMGASSMAAPIGPLALSAPQNVSAEIVPVRDTWQGREWKRHGNWQSNRRWQGNSHWQGNRGWNRPRQRDRHWHRPYRHNGWSNNAAIGLGAGGLILGLGAGSYYGNSYYDPYYAPDYYAPRRTYRVYRGGNAHVRWCYNRYRSYRAYDNTFQPYHGPRRQCRSPFG